MTLVLSSFDTHNARNLRQEAGNAIAYGLDREAALRAVTLEPARVWGVADRLGSLEVGKDADVVVWSGDPFELTTAAERVFIAGREMSKDTRQRQLLEKYQGPALNREDGSLQKVRRSEGFCLKTISSDLLIFC